MPPAAFSDAVRDRFLPDFAAWRATLPKAAEACPVDFMLLEVFSSATVGTMFPALWRNFYISPYNSRALIALSLRFDTPFRRACA
ncbi:MAG: hypothetical protein AAF626_17395 [Pseudomonadota bacterium]